MAQAVRAREEKKKELREEVQRSGGHFGAAQLAVLEVRVCGMRGARGVRACVCVCVRAYYAWVANQAHPRPVSPFPSHRPPPTRTQAAEKDDEKVGEVEALARACDQVARAAMAGLGSDATAGAAPDAKSTLLIDAKKQKLLSQFL